jgi:uncharacterized protein (DUF2345 family)
VPGASYEVLRSDGSILQGATDAQGKASKLASDAFEQMKVKFLRPDN